MTRLVAAAREEVLEVLLAELDVLAELDHLLLALGHEAQRPGRLHHPARRRREHFPFGASAASPLPRPFDRAASVLTLGLS